MIFCQKYYKPLAGIKKARISPGWLINLFLGKQSSRQINQFSNATSV